MTGRIGTGMMMVLLCYVAAQKHGAAAAEESSKDVVAKLEAAEASSRDLSLKLERLEALYEGQVQSLNMLTSQLFVFQSQIQQQNERNNKQDVVIGEQSKMIAGLQLENQQHGTEIAEQAQRIAGLELENCQQQDNILSFTASASATRTYNAGDQVLFDSAIRNYGEAYDSITSTFTCSHSAYYLFSLAVRTIGDTDMHAQIQLEGTKLVSVYADDNDMGTNLAVTYCAEGQRVWVICVAGQGQVMFGDSNGFSVFSGTLLSLSSVA